MHDFFRERRPHDGWTYDAYLAQWQQGLDRPLAGLDKRERRYLFYARYNWERAQRVAEAYEVSDALREAIETIDTPQLWLVLTEDWCVDSAFSLPIIHEAAGLNPHITLRILARDANLDIMEHYLTNGGRSIPKLIAFDEEGTELFAWGPRPAEIQQRRQDMQKAGASSQELSQAVLAFYEQEGWRQVDAELTVLVGSVVMGQ